jgi:hypothetical protein
MSKAKSDFPPPLISAWRVRFLAVAFGAPDDNQTVDGIENPFDRERYRARIEFERERRRLNRDATFKYYGAESGRFQDIADTTARAEAKQFIVEGYGDVESYAREALQYPALIRGNARLMKRLLNPWFDSEQGVKS